MRAHMVMYRINVGRIQNYSFIQLGVLHAHIQTCCCRPSGGMIVACSFCEFENNHCFCMPIFPHMHVHLFLFPILFTTVAARRQVHSTGQGLLHTEWTRVITELTVGHVPASSWGLMGTCLDPALVGSHLDMSWFLSQWYRCSSMNCVLLLTDSNNSPMHVFSVQVTLTDIIYISLPSCCF